MVSYFKGYFPFQTIIFIFSHKFLLSMGIQVEFNPDLALRNIREYKEGRRKQEECIPEKLEQNKSYDFLKEGQRNYWLLGELPLVETEGNQKLSRPIASIIITEVTHFVKDNKVYTKGKYKVKEIFTDNKPHFNGFQRII